MQTEKNDIFIYFSLKFDDEKISLFTLVLCSCSFFLYFHVTDLHFSLFDNNFNNKQNRQKFMNIFSHKEKLEKIMCEKLKAEI